MQKSLSLHLRKRMVNVFVSGVLWNVDFTKTGYSTT